VCALRSARVLVDLLVFAPLSLTFSPAFGTSPSFTASFVVALRSIRVVLDLVSGAAGMFSPAAAFGAALVSAFTSARVGAEAWAYTPCAKMAAAAAATMVRAFFIFRSPVENEGWGIQAASALTNDLPSSSRLGWSAEARPGSE